MTVEGSASVTIAIRQNRMPVIHIIISAAKYMHNTQQYWRFSVKVGKNSVSYSLVRQRGRYIHNI